MLAMGKSRLKLYALLTVYTATYLVFAVTQMWLCSSGNLEKQFTNCLQMVTKNLQNQIFLHLCHKIHISAGAKSLPYLRQHQVLVPEYHVLCVGILHSLTLFYCFWPRKTALNVAVTKKEQFDNQINLCQITVFSGYNSVCFQ